VRRRWAIVSAGVRARASSTRAKTRYRVRRSWACAGGSRHSRDWSPPKSGRVPGRRHPGRPGRHGTRRCWRTSSAPRRRGTDAPTGSCTARRIPGWWRWAPRARRSMASAVASARRPRKRRASTVPSGTPVSRAISAMLGSTRWRTSHRVTVAGNRDRTAARVDRFAARPPSEDQHFWQTGRKVKPHFTFLPEKLTMETIGTGGTRTTVTNPEGGVPIQQYGRANGRQTVAQT
jgi:hypothetical protein